MESLSNPTPSNPTTDASAVSPNAGEQGVETTDLARGDARSHCNLAGAPLAMQEEVPTSAGIRSALLVAQWAQVLSLIAFTFEHLKSAGSRDRE